ncbi:glycosyltransferase [Aminobacter sp. AP02]|uniref:glycosyltransferase n=1 Tax=Aminobacter sp. AP02 TaxID=2135737 RepID=UPI000D78C9A2|nr:glycosyltransferase [Aminobacter sp. AP02]PWK65647.1 UDP-N-acetylglucosamine:LPS N-acetylglucosamine transferase [Aminobacter sp. AP02]
MDGLANGMSTAASKMFAGGEANRFDVVYVGDFRKRCDAVRRVVEEVLLNAEIGWRTGLVHIAADDTDGVIDSGIMEVVTSELALSLDYSTVTEAALAILVGPTTLLDKRPRLPVRLFADRVLAIVDSPSSKQRLTVKNEQLIQYFGDVVSWTATTYDALDQLRESGMPTLGTIWQAFGHAGHVLYRNLHAQGRRPIIGVATDESIEHWPSRHEQLQQIWDSERYRVRVIGQPPNADVTRDWEVLSPNERSHVRFACGLDAFLYYPDERPAEIPVTAIGSCLARDIPVFLPEHLKPVLGKGPNYTSIGNLAQVLHAEIHGDPRRSTPRFNATEAHRRRMRFWLNGSRQPFRPRGNRPVLFFSSNGDGLGHLTRLLAIARKLPGDVTPVFASLSAGIGVVEDAGYHVEMIASHRYANLEERLAYPWMAEELAEILARHEPSVFVFDGGNPYGFMTDIVATRRTTAYVWLRRGMWQKEQDNAPVIAKEKFFDVIVEPSDLAGANDVGATASRRGDVLLVEPICLIDPSEQLSREEARSELELLPDRPAALIQLGTGNRRDSTITMGRILSTLASKPDLQIVNLNGPISRYPVNRFNRVNDVAAYPVARYLRAFDFAVSAAGYNSFHELMTSALPTIFVVSMTSELDDQYGRATYAKAMGCGFALKDDDLSPLPDLVEQMMSPLTRETMRQNCSRLGSSNGAREVADVIAELAR